MDSIEKVYLQIILEAQYETDIWKRYSANDYRKDIYA